MPCTDVTEIIEVALDPNDRLKSYSLSKKTCGQPVGQASLLVGWLRGLPVEDILACDADTFLAEHPVKTQLEGFLTLKHLFALQSALQVLAGKEPGGPDDPCAATSVRYAEDELVIRATIRVDMVTDKIKACGHCKGCGKSLTPAELATPP